jgi:hypothetical protein
MIRTDLERRRAAHKAKVGAAEARDDAGLELEPFLARERLSRDAASCSAALLQRVGHALSWSLRRWSLPASDHWHLLEDLVDDLREDTSRGRLMYSNGNSTGAFAPIDCAFVRYRLHAGQRCTCGHGIRTCAYVHLELNISQTKCQQPTMAVWVPPGVFARNTQLASNMSNPATRATVQPAAPLLRTLRLRRPSPANQPSAMPTLPRSARDHQCLAMELTHCSSFINICKGG